jgi:hypothetical protein
MILMKNRLISFCKKATTFLILAVCLVSFNMPLHARQQGQGGTPEERAKRQTEMMKTELKLTAAQEPKVDAINLKYAKKMQEARNTTDTAVRRKTFETLNKQKDAELKGVFTADQFKKYQQIIAEIKARRKQGGGPQK